MTGLSVTQALRVSLGKRELRPGEKVVACGASAALGNWDPSFALELSQSKVNSNEWVLKDPPKEVRRGTPFKYVVVCGGLAEFEEDRPNRTWEMPSPLHRFNALEKSETDLGCRLTHRATLAEVVKDPELVVVWGGTETWGGGTSSCPGAIFHAFNWQFKDVARHAEKIASYGFDAVQLSPAQRSKDGKEWYFRYQPVQYDVIAGLGDSTDLAEACAACAKHGIKVIGDCVFNHMIVVAKCEEWRAAQTDPALMEELQQRLDDAVGPGLDRSDFQWPWYPLEGDGWDGPWRMEGWGCGEWSELCGGAPRVVAMHSKHLELLAEAGVSGFRMDAAKHMRPQHLATYGAIAQELVQKHRKTDGKVDDCYIYGEVLSQEPSMHREYQDGAAPSKSSSPLPTTDFRVQPWLRNLLKQGKEGGVQLDSISSGRGGAQKGIGSLGFLSMAWTSLFGSRGEETVGWSWTDSVDAVKVRAPLIAGNSVRFTRNHDTVHSDGLGFFNWNLESAAVGTAWMLAVHDGSMLILADDVEKSTLIQEAVAYRAAMRKLFEKVAAQRELEDGKKAKTTVWTDIRVRPAMGNGPPMLVVITCREGPRAPWAHGPGSDKKQSKPTNVGRCLGFAVLNPNAHAGSGRFFLGSSALVDGQPFSCARVPLSKYNPQRVDVSANGVLDSPFEVGPGQGMFFLRDIHPPHTDPDWFDNWIEEPTPKAPKGLALVRDILQDAE